jgi:hypothetical protein
LQRYGNQRSGSDSKASSLCSVYRLTATGGSLKSGKTGTIPFLRLYGFYHNTFILEGKEKIFGMRKGEK